jgi:hypothetical protein
MEFIKFIERWISQFGVAGLIGAGLAAVILLVLATVLGGEAVTRFARRWTGPPEERPEPLEWVMEWALMAAGASLIFVIALLAGAIAIEPLLGNLGWVLAYLFVFVLGGSVGAAELVSRYRDRPFAAIATAPALFYILLNAFGAVGALYLIYIFHDKLGLKDEAGNWPAGPGALVQAVLIAGFSSLAFFRTSIFKFRAGDSDLAVGPSIVLDALLGAADRAVDRVMAQPRAGIVHEVMGNLAFEKVSIILPSHCLALMQNVSSVESQRVAGVVNSLRADKDMPDKIKVLNLGLALLGVVGEDVLRTAVKGLERDLRDSTATLLDEIETVMSPIDFDLARVMLPNYCYALWPKPIADDVKEKEKLEIKTIAELKDAPAHYKSLILGIRLAKLTDGATVRKAVSDLGDSIYKPLALPAPMGRKTARGKRSSPAAPGGAAADAVARAATTGPAMQSPAPTAGGAPGVPQPPPVAPQPGG